MQVACPETRTENNIRPNYMKKIVSVFLCALLSIAALAQPANLLSMARTELEKRGLNETEVRARLLETALTWIPSSLRSIPPTREG